MLLSICGAVCEATDSKNEIFPGVVPFKFFDMLDEYSVSGLWFPREEMTIAGLSGPAIFTIKNSNSGKHWTIAMNAIALLDKDFWKKHQVPDAEKLGPKVLLEKLLMFGVVSISLSDKRAKISDCKRSLFNPPHDELRVDCLELGAAVVDLQDIDFDGKKEFVFRHAGVAQRFGDAYEIVRIPDDFGGDDFLAGDTREPFRDIDFLTVINITQKQIIIQGSNGTCGNTAATYSRGDYGGMNLTHYWTNPEGDNTCIDKDYAVETGVDGIERTFKLLSPRKEE